MAKSKATLIVPPTKMIPCKDLKEYPGNPRTMSRAEFNNLCKSLQEHGLVQDIIVDERNQILGGNQRLRALKKCGYGGESIPCKVIDFKGDTKAARSLNVKLNRIHGEFDMDMLFKFLEDFDAAEIEDAGFDSEEMEELRRLLDDANSELEEEIASEGARTRVEFDADLAGNKIDLKFGGFKAKIDIEKQEAWVSLYEQLVQAKVITSERQFVTWLLIQGRRAAKNLSVGKHKSNGVDS
jgi:ParB-like chromosome segregation protein Spo0J